MSLARLAPLSLLAFSLRVIEAQTPDCGAASLEMQDACFAAVDLFIYTSPQVGLALSGGNLVLVQGGTISGFPHFTIGVRANVVNGNLPDLQAPSTTGSSFRTPTDPYPTTDQYMVLPTFDVAVGLFEGIPTGRRSHFGGLDLLLTSAYVPTVEAARNTSTVVIRPSTPVNVGFGVRIGLLTETRLVPGISVGVMQRLTPRTTIRGTLGSDTLAIREMSLAVTSWRVTIGKSFVGVRMAAGAGQDIHDNSATLESILNRPGFGRVTTGPLAMTHKATRTNVFADLALSLGVLQLVAEGGIATGGDFETSNVFDAPADVSRIYGSAGLRLSF